MTSEANELERQALELVEAALEQPPATRRNFVVAQTEDGPNLRERVFSILDGDGSPIPPLQTGGAIDYAPSEPIPVTIGAYSIEREIGSGGMGSVYFGRRMTSDFDHVAAIKVVRADAASPRLIERLRAERRVLARLKHPNIAQMYDGGETDEGAPYFIMEYVAGAPLNEYLSENDVSLSQRLRIFLDVCDAVAFAHRNLVIHRDLSPANILATEEGRVKLIDFGIAHSFGKGAPAHLTAGPQLTKTKGYAAPEREHGAAASTITDIYSLGVLLDEMISGINAQRSIDLKAIAAKASASTPDVRYQSVDALVHDIKAYQSGGPVAAVEGGWTYFLARFVGKRRIAVGASAIAVAAAVATSVIMSVLYVRAEAAERQAIERFNEVRELAGFIMFDFHDEVAKLDGSTQAREMLTKTALEYLDTLSETQGAPDALKLEIARGYQRLSDVTGGAGFANLGRRSDASELVDKAAAQITALRQTAPENPDVQSAFAEIIFAQAVQEGFSNNDFAHAIALLDNAQTASAELIARGSPSLQDQLVDAYIDLMGGFFLRWLGEYEAAVARAQVSLDKYHALTVDYPNEADVQLGLARANVTLAEAMAWRAYEVGDNYDATLQYFDAGVEKTRGLLTESNPSPEANIHLVISLLKRANTTCYIPGRAEEGLIDLNEAEAFAEKLIANNPNNDHFVEQLTHVIVQKSDCYSNLGRFAEAANAGNEAVARREAQVNAKPNNPGLLKELANAQWVLARLYIAADDWSAACTSAKNNLETWRRFSEHQTTLNETNQLEQSEIKKTLAECAKRGFS